MLREVHGRSQLYVPQTKAAGTPRDYHRRHLLPAGLRMRGRMMRPCNSNHRLWGTRHPQGKGHRRGARCRESNRVIQLSRGLQRGHHRPRQLQRKNGAHWHHALPRIGKRARRLPPRQQRRLCVETLGYARHSEGSRRAHPKNPSRLQAGETTPTPLRRGKAQGHRRRDSQTIDRRIHQGGTPPRVAGKPRSCTKEKREMEDVC